MKLRFALTALCALVAAAGTAAAKEAPVGQIVAVTGNVSVGGSSFISKATAGTSLHAGNTVLVSSNGKATVTVGKGCVIQLGASQHLRVTPGLKCEQQQASVKQMFAAYQVAQAPVPGSTPVPPVAPAAILPGAAAAPLLPALGLAPVLGIGAGAVRAASYTLDKIVPAPTSGS
jgi:hypothetical protein